MINVIALIILLPMWLVRWLRWSGFTQQKEYRLDRFWSFIKTKEGNHEVARLLPTLKDFSRNGLKRPALTPRAMVMLGLSFLLQLLLTVLVSYLPFAVVWYLVLLALIPLWVWLAILPTTLFTGFITWSTLGQASQLIKKHQPLVIGIGGCYGKTTTKHLLAHVLSTHFSVFTTPKSFNTRYSVAKSIVDGFRGQKIAIIEYGAYTFGEIKELARYFPPQHAVETGFTEQHLELFGSIENIIKAEGELPASVPSTGLVFAHAADPGVVKIVEHGLQTSGAHMIPYTGDQAVVKLHDLKLSDEGQLAFTWRDHHIQTRLIGKHYEANVRAAIAVAEYLKVPEAAIVSGLNHFIPNERFVKSLINSHGALVIDDGYATNPQGFKAVLTLAQELKEHTRRSKVVLVFGGIVDLGELSSAIHTQLADLSRSLVNQVQYTGEVGLPEFQAVFGSDIMTEITTDPDTIIIIEGRIPVWLDQQLKQ